MMMWRKPAGMKYVDLCIFIDEHAHEIINPGENEELENLIYNYIWLLVKALAIKKHMFENFNDYDGYALHSANRLFFALRKSYINAGKIIKGKEIKPIKSILNYTKALLYPMKLEYLNDQYNINEQAILASRKFDEFAYKQQLSDNAWYQHGGSDTFRRDVQTLFANFNSTLTKVLEKSPFTKNTIDYKKIRISVLLNCMQILKSGKGLNSELVTVHVWKLPKSMGNYIRLFIKEVSTQLKQEIMSFYENTQIDERLLDYMISNPNGEYIDHEE